MNSVPNIGLSTLSHLVVDTQNLEIEEKIHLHSRDPKTGVTRASEEGLPE